MVKQLEPSERFSISDLPRPFERIFPEQPKAYDPTVYEPIIYKCETCNTEIQFEEKDFEKHSQNNFSNLNKKHQEDFNNYILKSQLNKISFLDFYCPGCHKPVMVLYKDGAGGRHGDYIISIETVLEIDDGKVL